MMAGLPPEPGPDPGSFHMTPDEFRRRGTELVEWIADYMETVEQYPVLSRSRPGDVRAALPTSPPDEPEPFEAVMADVERAILPGITHWQSPGFFGFFPANSSGPSVLGELLSAGLGVQGMSWATSPAATELETLVMDWLIELLGLPDRFLSTGPGGGVIQHSASDATLCALLAARQRAGASGDLSALRAYASVEAHSSVDKAVRIAGLDPAQLRSIATGDGQAMRAEALAEAVDSDVAEGLTPFFVMATAGTASSMAFDPVGSAADICARVGAWLHVDAAMAGSAAVEPALRWVNDGVERADSYCFNPHKWLFTNFDCDAFWVADRSALLGALSVMPEYLRNVATESGAVIDYRDWHVPLGRRFRALKLWFVLRHYGARGLRHHVTRHVELAQDLAARVQADDRFVLAAPCSLNLLCLRHVEGDDVTERILDEINAGGRQFLTHTRIDGRYVIRVCVGQTHTDARHVEALWERLDSLA